MDKEDVVKLKSKLPWDYLKVLHERTNVSESAIFKTFSSKSKLIVDKVVDAALDVIEEKKIADRTRKERIENL